MRAHSFAVGQRLSYPDSHPPDEVRKGSCEIASLLALRERGPQDQIRRANPINDRVVLEPELQWDPAQVGDLGDC